MRALGPPRPPPYTGLYSCGCSSRLLRRLRDRLIDDATGDLVYAYPEALERARIRQFLLSKPRKFSCAKCEALGSFFLTKHANGSNVSARKGQACRTLTECLRLPRGPRARPHQANPLPLFKLPALVELTNTKSFAAWFIVTGDATADEIRVVRSVLGAMSSPPIAPFGLPRGPRARPHQATPVTSTLYYLRRTRLS